MSSIRLKTTATMPTPPVDLSHELIVDLGDNQNTPPDEISSTFIESIIRTFGTYVSGCHSISKGQNEHTENESRADGTTSA